MSNASLWFWAGLGAFLVSLAMSCALLGFSKFSRVGQDRAYGVQKVHTLPTSRLGGVAIAMGFLAALAVLACLGPEQPVGLPDKAAQTLGLLLMASSPVFFGGLAEDLTHKVMPSLRLGLALLSAGLAYWLLGVGVYKTDVFIVDALLSIPAAPFFVTLLVVAGFTQSVNIVDGFHGLASGSMIIAAGSLMLISWQCNDGLLTFLCGLALASVLGFFLLNWPHGKIFLGDAGAYLVGFWVVLLGLMLVQRNPSVSPMAPVVIAIFPLVETLFSMYRRKFIRQQPVNYPDHLHLHSLIYRRLVCGNSLLGQPRSLQDNKEQSNARVAYYFWLPGLLFAALAIALKESTTTQLALMLVYLGMYFWLYQRLVSFRAPAWLQGFLRW
jgi:UDP-N-acetylmuramyl pentapeptide phosphotransferase/UDP-N-acetylglucosamine-1-phosphate transferase